MCTLVVRAYFNEFLILFQALLVVVRCFYIVLIYGGYTRPVRPVKPIFTIVRFSHLFFDGPTAIATLFDRCCLLSAVVETAVDLQTENSTL
jgi:hypothetical protein